MPLLVASKETVTLSVEEPDAWKLPNTGNACSGRNVSVVNPFNSSGLDTYAALMLVSAKTVVVTGEVVAGEVVDAGVVAGVLVAGVDGACAG